MRRSEFSAFSDIAGARQKIIVIKALREFKCAVFIRPDAKSGNMLTDEQQRTRRLQRRGKEDRLRLLHKDLIGGRRIVPGKFIFDRQRDRLGLRGMVERNIHGFARYQFLLAQPHMVAGVAVVTVAGVLGVDIRTKAERFCRRGHGDDVVPDCGRIARSDRRCASAPSQRRRRKC